MNLDLATLRNRLNAAMPSLAYALVELEHSTTRLIYPALSIEMEERKKDHVYRMTVASIDDAMHFFVHTHGESSDLTTKGTMHFSKVCAGLDEVFAIVFSCWSGPSS